MNQANLALAEAYYMAMSHKNIESMAEKLHPEIQFIGPMAELHGKENVLKAIKGFTAAFKKFSSGDQAMLVIDTEFPGTDKLHRTASLLKIKDGLIVRIELFYDTQPIETQKKRDFFYLRSYEGICSPFLKNWHRFSSSCRIYKTPS